VLRLWKDGSMGNEYFLVENRQKIQFDKFLPNEGLLIWHIDDSTPTNSTETHYKVALVQADARKDLELNVNRGDAGDCYPGSAGNKSFDNNSNPNSKSYAGLSTCVSVTNISAPGAVMRADIQVKCPPKPKTPKGGSKAREAAGAKSTAKKASKKPGSKAGAPSKGRKKKAAVASS
jgi:immune inhibitor A